MQESALLTRRAARRTLTACFMTIPDRRARGGFTYIELLAMLGIAGILLAIFVPFLMATREKDRQVRCADNLRRLRDSLRDYAAANHNDYPRAVYDPAVNRNGYTAFTGPYVGSPFSPAVGPSDVTASLWLLVRQGYARDTSVFICPSTNGRAEQLFDADGKPTPTAIRPNFRSAINLSYSYASPFSGYADYRLNSDDLPGGFALMADKNPGSSAATVAHDAPALDLAKGNSRNHGRAGQNVLYGDGTVSFEVTPYCGVGRDLTNHADGDNIYTALAANPLQPGDKPYYAGPGFVGRQYGPVYQYDSYLVPTDDDN